MKRFASHYLFFSLTDRYVNYYVELSGKEVRKVKKLDQEIESTIWLNGSIFLFPTLLSELNLKELITGNSLKLPGEEGIGKDRKVYAYYVSCLEIAIIQDLPITEFHLLSE